MAALANISEATVVETPLLLNDDIVEGNVDYTGRPVKRSKSGGWGSGCFIMVVEMTERSAYFGVSANLISYLTGPLGQSTATAAMNVNAWSGTAQLLPLLGGFLADSFFGRYRTIIIAFVLYILGLGLLTLSAVIPSFKKDAMSSSPLQFQIIMFFCSLYIVAIAQGMHKPCVQAFGADQFDELHPEESKAKSSFFNWCSFCICVAIIVSVMILTCIQDYHSWGLGFGIPGFLMGFALVWFLLGTMKYRFGVNVDQENAFARIGRVFVKATSSWRVSSSSVCTKEETHGVQSDLGFHQFKWIFCKEKFHEKLAFANHNKWLLLFSIETSLFKFFRFLNKALVVPDGSKKDEKACTISEVEEAKAVLRLLPIWFSCLVYGILYSQPATLFTKQGLSMDRSISPEFDVPAASLQCLINVTMIIFIPIYDSILVPITRSITQKPAGITMLQRIGIGIFFSFLSMCAAALLERKRLGIVKEYGLVDEPNSVVPMSVAWLIPQYLLFGVSESFAFIGLQEFFYDQVPGELKSTGVALYLSVMGVGGFLSSILIFIIEKVTCRDGSNDHGWFDDNLNKAHFDYFYWFLAGLSAMTLAIFVYFAKDYVYRRKATSEVA